MVAAGAAGGRGRAEPGGLRPQARQPDAAKPAAKGGPMTLKAAAEGDWRSPADKARDVWRHPVESLEFWGLKPGQTVVEFWPGTGWYSDIIAPYLAATGGKLYAASLQTDLPDDPSAKAAVEAYQRKLADQEEALWRGRRHGVRADQRPGGAGRVGRPGAVPAQPAQLDGRRPGREGVPRSPAALKPGGVLGVEEHRGEPGGCRTCWPPTAMCSRPM
jgi:predicted methyltransferase